MREMTFMDAAREGLAEEMARDPSVFVVGEGIGARGGNFNTTVGSTTCTAKSACAIRRSASEDSPPSAPARRRRARARWWISCSLISSPMLLAICSTRCASSSG